MARRKAFLAASASAFASIAILRYPAGAAPQFSYKLGHDDPATYPPSIRIADAVAKINEEAAGRLEIAVFPDSQLGGSTQMMTQLRGGALQFLRQIAGTVAQVMPVCGIDSLPYIYTSEKQAWAARDGALGTYLRSQLATIGIYAFAKTWDLGFRQIFNSARPINVPEDLQGLKLRVPVDQVEVTFFKAMGGSPTPLNVTEMYTGLQTHLLDGGELPLGPILSRKLYEVQKYLSLTNHISTGEFMMANLDAWNALPKDLQEIVSRNFDAAAVASREEMVRLDADIVGQLVAKGMVSNQANIPAFKAAVKRAGLYAQWRDQFGSAAWAMLEKSVGPLA